jgi:hypothetical protein
MNKCPEQYIGPGIAVTWLLAGTMNNRGGVYVCFVLQAGYVWDKSVGAHLFNFTIIKRELGQNVIQTWISQ